MKFSAKNFMTGTLIFHDSARNWLQSRNFQLEFSQHRGEIW